MLQKMCTHGPQHSWACPGEGEGSFLGAAALEGEGESAGVRPGRTGRICQEEEAV